MQTGRLTARTAKDRTITWIEHSGKPRASIQGVRRIFTGKCTRYNAKEYFAKTLTIFLSLSERIFEKNRKRKKPERNNRPLEYQTGEVKPRLYANICSKTVKAKNSRPQIRAVTNPTRSKSPFLKQYPTRM